MNVSREGRIIGLMCILILLFISGCENTNIDKSELNVPNTTIETINSTQEVSIENKLQEKLQQAAPEPETYTVSRVIDGDTFVLDTGEKVRLIGMDTPETYEDYYREAKSKLEALITGEDITLRKDVSETDRYGRLLRYVYVGEAFVNIELVKEGYAKAYPYPPDTKYKLEFSNAEELAKQNGLGIWQVKEAEPITPTTTPAQPSSGSETICSHNAYNCGDFTLHSEAQKVFEACGGINNDIHILDKDKDGLACESLP